ncbi:sulfatase-like hydrolase/transferase [Streptomyces sp. NBC_01481]|uniref:sulfatase-like hydrolase/transferase n=1 Tax=Streptomyces sp. NBC_01481 TaxID=2975869 RepID=UPI0022524A8A|nr:sulfatase-like hydrolase/transferase [Streptomyces sp. NBC_01481]MCX4584697.1 esterase [Streptomyces sp. NBC_01481]
MINAAEVIQSRTSILFVTLDSLRYDVARAAMHAGQTPHLAALLPAGQWEERRTPGTFTLPAHMAFFSGFLPKLPQPHQPSRLWECRPPAFKEINAETFVFDAPNLLAGLALHGYRTVCVGGVTYFSRETPLGSVLPDMFDEDQSQDSWRSQSAALAYADEHLGRLVNELSGKGRWLIIMCADHGDAFGEDGYHGRGITHPVVMNVPFAAMVV